MKDSSINKTQKQELLNKSLKQAKAEQWNKNNRKAIQVYNDVILKHGMFGDEYRQF